MKKIKCKLLRYTMRDGSKAYKLFNAEDLTTPIAGSNLVVYPRIPEHVIEAFEAGIRHFELVMKEEPVYRLVPAYTQQGLMDIVYEKPKKQTFTREEVTHLLKQSQFEVIDSEIDSFLDRFFK